jgi:hypothetical protein
MNSTAFKSFLAATLALIATLGGLDAKQVTSVFPPGWGGFIAAVLSGCAVLAHFFTGVAKAATPAASTTNGSFKG